MGIFKAAAIQMRSGTEPRRNAVDFEALVREAAGKGATYVQTPEMTGAIVRDKDARALAFKAEEKDEIVAAAARLSAELGIFLHVGSTAILQSRRQDRQPCASVCARRRVRSPATTRSTCSTSISTMARAGANLPPMRLAREALVVDIGMAKLGFAICYDLRFPQLFRAEALAGAEVLTVPAAFTRQTGQAHWHLLLRARAIENGAFVIAAAQGGVHEDGRETFGHSLIVDPWGKVLAEADHDEPGVIVAEIDTALSAQARKKIPNLKNAREFSVASVSAAQPAALRGAAS